MIIRFSRQFQKQYKKLPRPVQLKVKQRIKLWEEDMYNSLLHTHQLTGKLKNYYSINITGDIRALYEVEGGDVYLYDLIGSHSQLYG